MSQLPWHFYIYDVSIFHLSLHSFPYTDKSASSSLPDTSSTDTHPSAPGRITEFQTASK